MYIYVTKIIYLTSESAVEQHFEAL